jgi:hypothetical protein
MESLALYRRSVDDWTRPLDGSLPQHWDQATPCSHWTVRLLVNHVVGEDAWTVPLMKGATVDDVGDALDVVEETFSADGIEPDSVDAQNTLIGASGRDPSWTQQKH